MDSENYPPNGRDSETLIQKCCTDLAVRESVAIEILEWAEENFTVSIAHVNPVIKQSIALEKLARWLVSFKNPWLGIRVLLFAIDTRSLDDVLNHGYPSQWARQAGCTKQNVNKLLSEIQEDLNLEPRKDQRTAESKQKMSIKRQAKPAQSK
jgi:hypothetical protein